MNRFLFVFFVLLGMLFLFAGCDGMGEVGSLDEEPDITGYVVEEQVERILVVGDRREDFTATGGLRDFYDAIMLTLTDAHQKVEVGDLVNVWFDGGVDDSYPGLGSVKSVEVVTPEKPHNAVLPQQVALRKGLDEFESQAYTIYIPTDISFREGEGEWEITLLPVYTDGEVESGEKVEVTVVDEW